ncbi:hypothetical protein [uncultured Cetobacterium sp.]|uniref:hypothetical protein n=1 Tax=uncultured Cetobacterium sp. TaxID=527638 RepID=UPI0026246B61|nr:hypothetical protein [uncultured Cetobacterium sp.]
MNNIKDKFKDRLKDKLSKHENGVLKNKISEENSITETNISEIIDFQLINTLVEDKNIIKELKENSIKIFSIQSKAVIDMGEIFHNVYNLLSKSGSKDGVYTKWLEITGVSPRTALNYRKRYDLYCKVSSEGKILIKKMPQKIIDNIYNMENKDNIVNAINKGEDFLKYLSNNLDTQHQIEIKKSTEFFQEIKINKYIEVFNNLPSKYNNLNEKKKRELEKYLKKIDEILDI